MLGLVISFSLMVFTTVVLYFLQRRKNQIQSLPPGPIRLPFIGSVIPELLTNKDNAYVVLKKLSKKYGPLMYLEFGVLKTVVISGYETCKLVLSNEDFIEKTDDQWVLQRTFGKRIGAREISFYVAAIYCFADVVGNHYNFMFLGITNATPEVRRENKRFFVRNLREFGFGKNSTMESATMTEFESFAKVLEKRMNKSKGVVNTEDLFTQAFINITWTMITGTRFDYEDPQMLELIHSISRWLKLVPHSSGINMAYPVILNSVPTPLNFNQVQKSTEKMNSFLAKTIQMYRDKRTYKTDPQNYVEIFLNEIDEHSDDELANMVYSDENLISVLFDMLIGATGTSSNIFSYAVSFLIHHPKVQERVREEIYRKVGAEKWPSLNDKPKFTFIKFIISTLKGLNASYLDFGRLIYTEATLLEIIRMSSPVPVILRKVSKDVSLQSYTIPKGTNVLVNLYSCLMDEHFWVDPQNFRPERFISKSGAIINADRVTAFSLGKRSCMGESVARPNIFIFFTRLVQQYVFELDPNTSNVKTKAITAATEFPVQHTILIKPGPEI